MNALTQLITQQVSGGAVRAIAQRLGVSESTANAAVQIGVPLILTALARNAAQPQGAASLHQAINNDHDGSILDNVMSYLGNPQSANGAGILGHVLGSDQPAVASNLAGATGMDQNSASSFVRDVGTAGDGCGWSNNTTERFGSGWSLKHAQCATGRGPVKRSRRNGNARINIGSE